MERFYERSGIKITVPEGYNVIEEDYVALYKRLDNGKIDVVEGADCCLESPDKGLWVLYNEGGNSYIEDGRDDKIDHPKRFAWMELAKYYSTSPGNEYPFSADDYISSLSGKDVRQLTNADVIYYYRLPLKGYKLVHHDFTLAQDVHDDYRFYRFYICKAGGYMFKFFVIDRSGADDMILSHMDEVLSSIWFDTEKIRKVWEVVPPAQ